jgi:hypothetical protein
MSDRIFARRNVLPTAMAIAILRQHLCDIDHLINRTVVDGAASTLAAFALFQPIRRRVQDAVDRRVDRSRYDAARTLDAFTEHLRDEVDLDDLRADLISAVRRTMFLSHASLWLRARR